jgi:hypothetical protein
MQRIDSSFFWRKCSGATILLFSSIAYVDLSFTSVTDVSMLGSVEFLTLRYCAGITDVSKLGQQTKLDLSLTSVRVVSHLGNVQSLNLSHTHVDDATGLADIYNRNLNYTTVSDVSMLGGVFILHLQGTLIEDVSSLNNMSQKIMSRLREKTVV